MRQRRGMTLVEAVLALSLTVVIGLIATTVTVAMLDLRQRTDTYNQNMQAARVGMAQLQKIIRTSLVIVDGDQTSMTLWAFDDDDPGIMNAEEIVRLTYAPGNDAVVKWYVDFQELPSDVSEALNIPITLEDGADWNRTCDLVNTAYFEVEQLATDVSSITFRYDASPPRATMVAIDATFAADGDAAGGSDDGRRMAHLHTAAKLRTPRTSDDELADAGYSGEGQDEED